MKNKTIVRIITAIVTLCMFLSMAPVLAFGAEPQVEIIISYDGAEDVKYHISDQISGDSDHYLYWYDGEIHYPDITVKVKFPDESEQNLVEGTDYSLSFSYTPNESFSPMNSVNKEDCKNPGFYVITISGIYGSTYEKQIDDQRASTEWFAIQNKPSYLVWFYRTQSEEDETSESSGIIANSQKIPADRIPSYTFTGHSFAGWYTDPDCSEGNKFDTDAVPAITYTTDGIKNGLQTVKVYAKWVEDTTPGGDEPTPGGDPTPEGDGTEGDGTDTGGKTQPDTGVENMMPLFIWLFAVSAMIIVSVRKKRA